jgi:hypothetical protein
MNNGGKEMNRVIQLTLNDLIKKTLIYLPHGGHIERHNFSDNYGSKITILTVNNGLLTFSILLERGMDIGEINYNEEKVSWERDSKYLLHPDNVNLGDNNGTGWIKGFYPAVAAIGPELFGTPGEGYTLHGTGSYSPAARESVHIFCDEKEITVTGTIPVKGYHNNPIFEKKLKIISKYESPVILREETTTNLSDNIVVLDDGLHIQMSGKYLFEGGRFILPVKTRYLLLRDSAPEEADPLYINPLNNGNQTLRCYQYVPEPVSGLEDISEINEFLLLLQNKSGITAEMIINHKKDTASYVIRPLDCFPRSLIAKEISDCAMFSFEPCRTRPNRMSQKITDGEAYFLEPGAESKTQCLIGITKDHETIATLETTIKKSAGL